VVRGHQLPARYMLVWFQVRSKFAEERLHACNGL
jgi:hypothetical protein